MNIGFNFPYLYAQSGEFRYYGDNPPEVGQFYSLEFEILDFGDAVQINRAEWTFSYGSTTGNSVTGMINFDINATSWADDFSQDPLTPNQVNMLSIDFILGDNAVNPENVELLLSGLDATGQPTTKPFNYTIYAAVINDPIISGPTDIQKCCQEVVNYTVANYGAGNQFYWTVQNASIVSGQNTTEVVVLPNVQDNFSVSCDVRRSQTSAAYLKSSTLQVDRFDPNISDLDGERYMCIGTDYDYFVDLDGLCDVANVVWSVPVGLDKISELEGYGIKLRPNPAFLYETLTIEARVEFYGGCVSNVLGKNVQIFEYGIPPLPDGKIEVIYPPDFDPCDDYILQFNYVPDNLYENAVLTVSPNVFIGVPHHIHGTTIDVNVCYYNPCSDVEKCTTFIVSLPAPCKDSRLVETDEARQEKIFEQKIASSKFDREEIQLKSRNSSDEELLIFPNPAMTYVHYFAEERSDLRIYDLSGRLVSFITCTKGMNKIDVSALESSLYFLSCSSNEGTKTTFLFIQ